MTVRPVNISSPLGDGVILFRRMNARERLGRLFQYDLVLLSEDRAIGFDDILGMNMTVSLAPSQGKTRYFNGYVSNFSLVGHEEKYAIYSATLRPWLWFLTRSSDCRIFQNKTVPEIIEEVFSTHGFTDFEVCLESSYGKQEYCVQYRETDFNFVSRLMEQEGIYYFFRHENGKHTLVLSDSSSAHEAVSGYEAVPYHPPTDNLVHDEEHISKWQVSREVQPGQVALADFDFERPRADLTVKSTISREHAASEFEEYDYPGNYLDTGRGEAYARTLIEASHVRFEQARGTCNARGLVVGSLFELARYPREDQNREYLAVSATWKLEDGTYRSVDQAGRPSGREDSHVLMTENGETRTIDIGPVSGEGTTYTCTFSSMDSRRPYRSLRTTPKPFVQGPQTATVVGKEGEEIWTDKHGRVKVQFHWDREGKADENSSCWIRVSQAWAGSSWGGIHIPRIGQEVIVDFLEGDPDRPIITGRVYNGSHKPPYDLPANQTISTIKSNSTKKGQGFNEIRLDDRKGEEQIFIHAEKNQDLRVKNDSFETIGHDRHLIVKNDQRENIENNRSETVGADLKMEIGKDRHLKVGGKEAKEVGGSLSLAVKGDVVEVFTANHSEQTSKDHYLHAKNIVIEAATNITIKVGSSFIAIESGGIKFGTTGELALESTGKASVKGTAGLSLESPASAELSGTSAAVKGTAATTIQGGIVKIN